MSTGIERFVDAVRSMGLNTELRDPLVLVELEVAHGALSGTKIWAGADPPPDFPTVPPHWLHLPSDVTIAGGGKQASELGEGWAKWSRPNKLWAETDSPGAQWVAHTQTLLATISP